MSAGAKDDRVPRLDVSSGVLGPKEAVRLSVLGALAQGASSFDQIVALAGRAGGRDW